MRESVGPRGSGPSAGSEGESWAGLGPRETWAAEGSVQRVGPRGFGWAGTTWSLGLGLFLSFPISISTSNKV